MNTANVKQRQVGVVLELRCLKRSLSTWKEDEHLVSWIIVVGNKHSKICPSWASLAGLVAKLAFKFVQSLI